VLSRSPTENAPQLARVYTRIEPRLLGVEDAARYLGVGPTTVRDLVMSGRLPRVRLDELRRTLLDRLDLDAFIARSREHAR
jgi:excisionase family DNA binding protein